jgi:solute:Na+ symporter, SSS family
MARERHLAFRLYSSHVRMAGLDIAIHPMIISFVLVFVLAVALTLHARKGHDMADPRAFFAARGQLGTLLYFMLAVGETYSIGTVLGFPAGIAAHGTMVALWFVGYILLAFPVGYVLYPRLWEAGRRTGAITLPDLFRSHFGSRALERLVTCILLVLMLPLGAMQFIGLSDVMAHLAPAVPTMAATGAAGAVTFGFVLVAGLRAPATVAILKDALMLCTIAAVAASAGLHWTHATSGSMQAAFGQNHPIPARDLCFVISTIMVQSVAFCIAPQSAAAVFSARDPASIRRAQIAMPLYMVLFPLLFLIADFAVTHGIDPANNAFLGSANLVLPDWAFGIVLAATALTAIVWLGAVCLSIAALVARNLFPGLDRDVQKRVGLTTIAGYLVLSILGAAFRNSLLTDLNTLFYLALVQLVPSVLALVRNQRPSVPSVMLGLAGGLSVAMLLRSASWTTYGVNPGLIGVLVNAAILRVTGRVATSN